MVEPLIDSLFRALLARPDVGLSSEHRRVLSDSPGDRWQGALEALSPHKVFPLLSHQLGALGVLDAVPEGSRERLLRTHREVRVLNTMHLLAAASILRNAGLAGEPLLLLKGLVLADGYYPDPSTRPMGDIDLVARPGRAETMFEAIRAAGFRPAEGHVIQEDAETFENAQGLTCDAHRTLRMFEGHAFESITAAATLRRLRGLSALVLEPNAMLAHLVVHMEGHIEDLGFVLLWLLDIAFVLRRVGEQLDLSRVRVLLGNEARFVLLSRVLGMLERAGEPLPRALAGSARVPPLSLGFVLRRRRLVPWGLPAPRGWARLLLHHLAVKPVDHRPVPRLMDLVLWPYDALSVRGQRGQRRIW